MIRLVGLALVWGGCALWGAKRARRVRGCVHVLEDMGWALEVLERELTLNRIGAAGEGRLCGDIFVLRGRDEGRRRICACVEGRTGTK